MGIQFRFGIISDLHIALSHTIWDNPNRFHLVEVSTHALEQALAHLSQLDLDFLLLPGDLTQHGEGDNHDWLVARLSQLPFPVYVVPGNHDIVQAKATAERIGLSDFPKLYGKFGYDQQPERPYYIQSLVPGVSLVGLNSIAFDEAGRQLPTGWLDESQLQWLTDTLSNLRDQLILVMIHHNVLEHLPGQAKSPLGQRYMLKNADQLLTCLKNSNAKLIFTGHLHVQDVVRNSDICEITTGSLVSYPHPYRVVRVMQSDQSQWQVDVESHTINAVPGWPDLLTQSRRWMGDRSFPFMMKLLTQPPLALPEAEAATIAPKLRDFWATIAAGDGQFDVSALPQRVQRYFEPFNVPTVNGCPQTIDNFATLYL